MLRDLMAVSFLTAVAMIQGADSVCVNPVAASFECGLDGFTVPTADPQPAWYRANHVDYGPPVDGSYFMDFLYTEGKDADLKSPVVSCPDGPVCLSFDFVINKYGPALTVLTKCGEGEWTKKASYNDETEPRVWEHRNVTLKQCPEGLYQVALRGEAPPYSYNGLAVDNVYIGYCAEEPRDLFNISSTCVGKPTSGPALAASTVTTEEIPETEETQTTQETPTTQETRTLQTTATATVLPSGTYTSMNSLPSTERKTNDQMTVSVTAQANVSKESKRPYSSYSSVSQTPDTTPNLSVISGAWETTPESTVSATPMASDIPNILSTGTVQPSATTVQPGQSSRPVAQTSTHSFTAVSDSTNTNSVTVINTSSTESIDEGWTRGSKTDLIVGISLAATMIAILVTVLVVKNRRQIFKRSDDVVMSDMMQIIISVGEE